MGVNCSSTSCFVSSNGAKFFQICVYHFGINDCFCKNYSWHRSHMCFFTRSLILLCNWCSFLKSCNFIVPCKFLNFSNSKFYLSCFLQYQHIGLSGKKGFSSFYTCCWNYALGCDKLQWHVGLAFKLFHWAMRWEWKKI